MGNSQLGSTSDLVTYINKISFKDIPNEAIAKVKLQILDCLGVALNASDKTLARIISSQVREEAGTPQSSVIGLGLRAPCATAAWANGAIAHSLDFDDNSIALPTAIHQTVTTLPAALSVGELVNANGRELLKAVTLGIEAGSKIDRALSGHAQAWHGTGTFGTLASTVAAAKLLQLNPEQLENALGTACSMAAGLVANFGTMTKPLHAGQASRNGVTAALLAKKGFTSARDILETKEGFAEVMGNHLDQAYLKEHLGNPWEILEPGVHIKMYPSCMATHAGLDAIIKLAKTHNIDPSAVASVEVTAAKDLRSALIYDEPKTALEGKFSMQYCIAIGLLRKRATLEEFTDQTVQDPNVINLLRKVRVATDQTLASKGPLLTVVKVKLKDGRSFEESVEFPKGSNKNPMSLDEVTLKFRDCTSRILERKRVDEIVDTVLRLEKLDRVSTLANLVISS